MCRTRNVHTGCVWIGQHFPEWLGYPGIFWNSQQSTHWCGPQCQSDRGSDWSRPWMLLSRTSGKLTCQWTCCFRGPLESRHVREHVADSHPGTWVWKMAGLSLFNMYSCSIYIQYTIYYNIMQFNVLSCLSFKEKQFQIGNEPYVHKMNSNRQWKVPVSVHSIDMAHCLLIIHNNRSVRVQCPPQRD